MSLTNWNDSWKWVKSCFNSAAWYDAAQRHTIAAAPTVIDAYNNKGMTVLNAAIVGAALVGTETAKNPVKVSDNAAKSYTVVNAIGEVAVTGVEVVGGVVVVAGLYAASNAATKIGKAIFWDRSKSAIKEAVSESLEDANAIRHGFQAVGDYAIGGIVNIAEGACNQTLGRVFNRHDGEPTDMAGDIIDADQA